MPDYFYDSSALAKNYHREVGTPKVTGLLRRRQANHLISRLTVIEIQSVLASKVRNGVIELSGYQRMRTRFLTDIARRRLQVIKMTGRHYQEAERLIHQYSSTRRLRTLDALQLVVALSFRQQGRIDCFVCADDGLGKIATLEGLPVLNPEQP